MELSIQKQGIKMTGIRILLKFLWAQITCNSCNKSFEQKMPANKKQRNSIHYLCNQPVTYKTKEEETLLWKEKWTAIFARH